MFHFRGIIFILKAIYSQKMRSSKGFLKIFHTQIYIKNDYNQ